MDIKLRCRVNTFNDGESQEAVLWVEAILPGSPEPSDFARFLGGLPDAAGAAWAAWLKDNRLDLAEYPTEADAEEESIMCSGCGDEAQPVAWGDYVLASPEPDDDGDSYDVTIKQSASEIGALVQAKLRQPEGWEYRRPYGGDGAWHFVGVNGDRVLLRQEF